MIRSTLIAGATAAALVGSASLAPAESYRDSDTQMSVVQNLDIDRYMGTWYEIARFPNRFEQGCEGVTADYARTGDGEISVVNTCHKGAPDGPVEQAEGKAELVAPGRLKVSFVPWLPFARGDYWVLHVDPAYSVAVVGEPSGKTGWILARSPQISAAKRAEAEAALERNGYDPSQLRDVLHR
ncbi:lipocalin family protein [Tropicimonas sediminicola]|uniref:Outer membrane lipoprotein Blc n=1 Tax=Tropicimonas sediminicola TaxID=1031541 RepID=A0A239GVT7_9RHOB|nr:lipocalin family protein [Tropicimonas sediminicola]SNS73250.1 apolipoprotein D and lipocalin family protein [Tropicimonas sediminicola]